MTVDEFKPSPEDVILWCDGTWCERSELDQMSHMSDDYTAIPAFTANWDLFYSNTGVRL